VLSINGPSYSKMALSVVSHEAGKPAFSVGESISVDITPATPVTLFGGKSGTVQNLQPGMFVQLYGLSDQPNRTIVSPQQIIQTFSTTALTAIAPTD
jgi:hypothetical protein